MVAKPWYSQLDLRILQDLVINTKIKQTVQFSIDFVNLGNLINSKWGVRQYATTSGYFQPLSVAYNGNNPIYNLILLYSQHLLEPRSCSLAGRCNWVYGIFSNVIFNNYTSILAGKTSVFPAFLFRLSRLHCSNIRPDHHHLRISPRLFRHSPTFHSLLPIPCCPLASDLLDLHKIRIVYE